MMKSPIPALLCSFCVLLFISLNASAATPTITVTLSDFTADHSGAGYIVLLTPTTAGSAARVLTDADGVASFDSVTPGIYNLSIQNAGVPSLQIRVPDTADTTAASTIVISAWTPPGSTAASPINATSISAGSVSNTEFDFLNGVTSALQTQINAVVTNSALTASRLLVSGADKTIASSSVTTTEAGYLSGVTSAIQTQLGLKQPRIITRFATATNYTLTAANHYVAATATLTNTLPAATTAGQLFVIKNISGTTTVRPAGSDTIDGVASDDSLTSKLSHTYIADGVSNWELN